MAICSACYLKKFKKHSPQILNCKLFLTVDKFEYGGLKITIKKLKFKIFISLNPEIFFSKKMRGGKKKGVLRGKHGLRIHVV